MRPKSDYHITPLGTPLHQLCSGDGIPMFLMKHLRP